MYRVWLEEILGVRTPDGNLVLHPNLPDDWEKCKIVYRHGYSSYEIEIESCPGTNRVVASLEIDGKLLKTGLIPLVDDGRHHLVRVTVKCAGGERLLPTGSEGASGE